MISLKLILIIKNTAGMSSSSSTDVNQPCQRQFLLSDYYNLSEQLKTLGNNYELILKTSGRNVIFMIAINNNNSLKRVTVSLDAIKKTYSLQFRCDHIDYTVDCKDDTDLIKTIKKEFDDWDGTVKKYKGLLTQITFTLGQKYNVQLEPNTKQAVPFLIVVKYQNDDYQRYIVITHENKKDASYSLRSNNAYINDDLNDFNEVIKIIQEWYDEQMTMERNKKLFEHFPLFIEKRVYPKIKKIRNLDKLVVNDSYELNFDAGFLPELKIDGISYCFSYKYIAHMRKDKISQFIISVQGKSILEYAYGQTNNTSTKWTSVMDQLLTDFFDAYLNNDSQ